MPKNSEIAVLDVGSGKIRAAVAVKNSRISVELRGIGEVDYAGYSEGKFLEPENLKEAIFTAVTKAEVSAGSKIKKIFVGVPAEFTYSVCREPALLFEKERKITNDEIAALFKKSDKFDNDGEFVTIDASPVYFLLGDNKRIVEPRGLSTDKIKALVSYVRCPKTFIDEIKAVFHGHSIEIEFVSAILAEILYLFEPEERDRYVLFADVGYISSGLALLRGDGILHLASFSMGGGHISADISELFQIPFDEAEHIKSHIDLNNLDECVKIKSASLDEEISGKDMKDVIAARLSYFADMFKICIKNSLYDCPLHVTMYLTGGGLSYLKGAKEFLSEALGRNIEIIAPNIPKYDKQPHYSVLFGLIDMCGGSDEEPVLKKKKSFFGELFKRKG
jgi:cell division protein FtsA